MINKKQLRTLLSVEEWVKDDLKRYGVEKLSQICDRVKKVGNKYYYVEVVFCDEYKFEINKRINKYFINDEEIDINNIPKLLNDIEDKISYLEKFDITPIEKYLSEKIGIDIKLNKSIIDDDGLKLESDNLVEHTGICKVMLDRIYVRTGLYFIIDSRTGEQCLCISSVYYEYDHSHKGRNGYEIAKLRYDMNTNKFTAYNYDTEKFEEI